jgi:hypothetical protein
MLFASTPQFEASGCAAKEPMKQIARNLVLLLCSATACAQATVEYGALAGKSSAATSGAASAVDRVNRRLIDVQQKTAAATPSQQNRVRTPVKPHVTSQPASSASNQPIRVEAGAAQKQSVQKSQKYQSTITLSFDQ